MDTITSTAADALFPRSRQAILRVLFGHPDRAFYLRELAERAGVGLSQLQRELKRLVRSGIIRRFEEGRHVYFQADPTSPIFDELRSLIKKTFGVADTLREALRPYADHIVSAFIYGSLARGEEKSASDVDVMVIGDASFRDIAREIKVAEDRLAREVNVTSYPAAEFAKKVAEGHHFLTSVSSRDKIFVIGDESDFRAILEQQVD